MTTDPSAVASREWLKASAVYDGSAPPPPWPLEDFRTPECRHGAHLNGGWGKKGERQYQCRRCLRWIWRHLWDAEVRP